MPSETASARRHPARNIQVLLGLACLLFFGWSWINFSGPFRALIDVQLRLFGSYSEPAAAIASAVVLIAAISLVASLVERACPRLSDTAASAVVAILFAAASVAAMWQVWNLWHAAAQMPRLSDPVQVVDLTTIGNANLPLGHVRVVGTPDRGRQVLTYSMGRHGMGSYWEAWVPITARQQTDPKAPVRIVATSRDSERAAAAKAVPDDPEGLLLAGSVDVRTVYEARLGGLDLDEHSFVLFPDDGVRFDKLTNAVLLGSSVVLFWGLAAYRRITGRRACNALTVARSASSHEIDQAQTVMATSTPASLLPEPARATETKLTRLGTSAAIAAVLAGSFLWEVFGFFPTVIGLWAYAAAALTLAVALLLLWLGQRFEEAAPEITLPPTLVTPMKALAPPLGAALLCVLRDEPGFSSTSYKRIDVDGARVANLKANRYIVVPLWPGPHTLAVNTRISLTSDTVARFAVAPGDVVTYRLQIPFFGRMGLERVPDISAVRAALTRLKPVARSDDS